MCANIAYRLIDGEMVNGRWLIARRYTPSIIDKYRAKRCTWRFSYFGFLLTGSLSISFVEKRPSFLEHRFGWLPSAVPLFLSFDTHVRARDIRPFTLTRTALRRSCFILFVFRTVSPRSFRRSSLFSIGPRCFAVNAKRKVVGFLNRFELVEHRRAFEIYSFQSY